MKSLILLLVGSLAFSIVGCDGDGGGDSAVASEGAPSEPSGVPGTGTDEEDNGITLLRVWERLLDTGGNVPLGTHFVGGVALGERSGTLRCVYTWDVPPTNLTCWLQQYIGGSAQSEHVTGPSPLTVTTHADGGNWSPYIQNGFSVPVYVRVRVEFLAD